MYDREALLNQMFVDYINTLAASVTQDNLHTRPVESGHTPLWILGHVAICAELGIKMLGGEIEHRAWLPLFAPGSKDNFTSSDGHSRDELLSCIQSSYAKLCEMASSADDEVLDRPHGVELLNDTVLNTVGDVVAHLMTTHLSFHAAQLSAWRQASGHKYLF
jgi:hypothetical protein